MHYIEINWLATKISKPHNPQPPPLCRSLLRIDTNLQKLFMMEKFLINMEDSITLLDPWSFMSPMELLVDYNELSITLIRLHSNKNTFRSLFYSTKLFVTSSYEKFRGIK